MAKKNPETKMMVMIGGAFTAMNWRWGVVAWPGTFFLVTINPNDGSLFPVMELTRAEALNEKINKPTSTWAEV